MKGSGSEYSDESLELLKKEVLSLKNYISRSLKTHLSDVKADFYYQNVLKEKVFSDEYDFPVATITSWSVALELGCWLYDTIIKRRPSVIVEYGSGLSTLIMAIALSRAGGGKLIAVEHDEEYYKKTRDLLKNAGLFDRVELLLCPLVEIEINGASYKWYSLTETTLENYVVESEVDLLFVDGPPAATGPNARFPAYHVTKKFLSNDALIVLDDADRADEAAIVNQWIEESNGTLVAQHALSVRHGAVLLTADPEWAGVAASMLPAGSQQDGGVDVSVPLSEELNTLVHERLMSRDLAANVMMRHKFHVAKELGKHQTYLLEQSTVISSARVNMALAVSGLKALDRVLNAAEKQSNLVWTEDAPEIIGVELNNTYDFSIRTLAQSLDESQRYISVLSERASTVIAWLLKNQDELRAGIKGIEKEKAEVKEKYQSLKQENDSLDSELADKSDLIAQAFSDRARLEKDNEDQADELNCLRDKYLGAVEELSLIEQQYAAQEAELEEQAALLSHALDDCELLRKEKLDLATEVSDLKAEYMRSLEEMDALRLSYAIQSDEIAQRDAALARALDGQELLRQENRAQKAELDNERADHSYSIAKLKRSRRKFDAQTVEFTLLGASLSEKSERLERLEEQSNNIESKLREIYSVSRQMQSDNYKYASSMQLESNRAEKIKKHLSYRLGAAMIGNSNSAKGWLTMPWALSRAYKEFNEYKKLGTTESSKDQCFNILAVDKGPLVIALEQKWSEIYIKNSPDLSQINISLIAVRQGASVGIEWLITDCDGMSNNEVERKCELTDAKHLVVCDIEIDVSKLLKIRKSRGVPAWLKVERVRGGQKKQLSRDLDKPQSQATQQDIGSEKPILVKSQSEKSTSPLRAEAATTKMDVSAVRRPIEKRTVLLDAHILMENGDVDRGLAYARENASEDEVHGIAILEANQFLNNEENWLNAVNRYILRLGIAPLQLSQGHSDLFFRFATKPLTPIESGPLISVIMPAYNCASTLEFAANSVLNQQWKNLELIIVDDCSEDDTWQVMRKIAMQDPRVRILRNSVNCGPYVSKNRAVDIARGEYITGHDSDDWAHPERLARHMGAVLADAKPVYASAIKMIRLRSNGKFERISATTANTFDGVMQTAFISTLFNTEFLRSKLGHWDCARFGADSEIISRCQALLGDRFIIYEQLGMLCLDSDEGLTAHPVHGTRGRTAPSRKHYKRAFLEWHEELRTKGESYVLPFPHAPRKFPAPKAVTVSNADLQRIAREDRDGRSFDLDVCILTDLRYPGGTASSTLDELHTCIAQGLRVRVFHCPTKLSVGKPVSSRYYQDVDHVEVQDFDVSAIRTKVLIVRHPMVITSDAYANLSKRIEADSIVYVINNSRYRANGEDAFDLNELRAALMLVVAKRDAKVYPLGPRIRRELESEPLPIELAIEDWHPLFDSSYYSFQPKAEFSSPIVIGRHGRDQIDKWPDSKSALIKVYPIDGSVNVQVLGGAGIVKKVLGRLPSTWTIHSFGAIEPPEFLRSLDVFVYFPSEGLNEAFGRTVMEAIFSGVPCVLPEVFKDSFGDLVFYADVSNVQSVISKLSQKEELRLSFVSMARKLAIEKFDSKVLVSRLAHISSISFKNDIQKIEGRVSELSLDNLLLYKSWVEGNFS